MSLAKGISPESFYGSQALSASQISTDAKSKRKKAEEKFPPPKFMKRLLGPSKTWRVFKKQQEALDDCLKRRNNLMCFAFEQKTGQRLFLVAHPKVFWAIDSSFLQKSRHNYEVIREFSVCKLYLDIEFELELNVSCNMDRMLSNFLKIINHSLKDNFNIVCNEQNILDLDSSTHKKYSHHIIYQIKNAAFENNYALGNFIKAICSELRAAYECRLNLNDQEKMKTVIQKYQLEEYEILELFVKDKKGKIKLFVDEGVYTKNRHFRLLGSSKASKNTPLVISKKNKYKPQTTEDGPDCNMFLDSLITYFSSTPTTILEFKQLGKEKRGERHHKTEDESESHPMITFGITANSKIDEFIQRLIHPKGKIRRKIFFSSSFFIVYEIQNFRYCHNIGREHKSNNIKYVVDLNRLTYYQKCFDPDCGEYKSKHFNLPEEICFLFSDELYFNNVADFDKEIIAAVEQIEAQMNILDREETDLYEITGCIEDALNENSV